MNRIEMEESPIPREPSFFARNKVLIIVAIIAAAVIITLAVVLPITLIKSETTTKSTTTTTAAATTTTTITTTTTTTATTTTALTESTTPDYISARVDCLPELKSLPFNDTNYVNNCTAKKYCKYQPISGMSDVPACYYVKEKLKLNLISEWPNDLGKSFVVERDDTLARNKYQLRFDFEYLEDDVLRFKVALLCS
jgi:hypothetical protein